MKITLKIFRMTSRSFISGKNEKKKFNGAQFLVLQYGPNEDMKNKILYFPAEMEDFIERFSSLRDLRVILSDDGKFEEHIEKVAELSARKLVG